ncbi:MAG: cytochrome P450 [Acidimicrobiia bacterium]|nr:cytochrome P450 [Acidimicrobiia bacterium]
MELNPFSYEFHEDPYPTYRWLRDHAPVHRNEELDFWALSRYADVVEASRDWSTYSSAQGTTLERLDPAMFETMPMMIFMDPPRQIAMRRLVNRAFTPHATAGLEDRIRSVTTALLEPLVERGGGDFVRELSALLPMEVIFDLLGVPSDDRRTLRAWMDESLARNPEPPVVPDRAIEAMANMTSYWFDFVADRRRRPGDDLVGQLVAAELETDEGPRPLTDGELVGFCSLLGAAGNETVTKLLANAVVLLHRHPDARAAVVTDPACIPGAVEEVLRYTSPSQYQGRTLTREVELHGVAMPQGARVLLLTASANRDERQFPDPDRFDVRRPPHVALGFGHGVHSCLGAHLARVESRVALEEFTRRFPRYEVDESRLERVHMSNVHGFSGVPFRAAA